MESVEIQWENNNICTVFDEDPFFEGGFRIELFIFSILECENRVPGMILHQYRWCEIFFRPKNSLRYTRRKGSHLSGGSGIKIQGVL